MEALEAADNAGFRVVEVGLLKSQLCERCAEAQIKHAEQIGKEWNVWPLFDDSIRQLLTRQPHPQEAA